MSVRLRAAWARPPKASADEIANEIRDLLRVIEDGTRTLVRATATTRDAIATLEAHADDADELPQAFVRQMVAEAEVGLAAGVAELDENSPLGRVMKNVIEPYNDAVRDYRRAVQDYLGACRLLLASSEARDAEDARVARVVMADEADAVMPWPAVRDNVRKIR